MEISDIPLSRKRKPILFWSLIIGFGATALLCIMLWSGFTQAVSSRNENADLYARMVENSITRTIESVEISLLSLSENIQALPEGEQNLVAIRERIHQIIRFAPHIRQIVLTKNQNVIVDSRGPTSGKIDFAKLGIPNQQSNILSLGVKIGQQVFGRFLPLEGAPQRRATKRTLIPLALNIAGENGPSTYTIFVALNSAYIRNVFSDLNLAENDSFGFFNFEGKALIGTQMPRHHREIFLAIQDLAREGKDSTSLDRRSAFFPEVYIALRLLEKYPLAVSISIDHRDTLRAWFENNSALILDLLITTFVIVAAATAFHRDYLKSAALQEQVRLLSAAAHQSPLSILITDENKFIRYVNPAFTTMFGYEFADVEGKPPSILKSGKTKDDVYEKMWGRLNRGLSWQGEFLNRRANGTTVPIAAMISPVRDEDGKTTHMIGMLSDITKRKKAEEHIHMLSQVVEQSPVTVVITDTLGNIEYVNRQFETISGYSMDEVIGHNPRLLKSGRTSSAQYQQLWDTITSGNVWFGEFHNQHKNGTLYWERASIGPLKNADGDIVNYIAVKEDISQLKADEKQLRLAAAVFDTATEAVMVTDAANRIRTVNSAFSKITGYDRESVLGANPSILNSGHHEKEYYDVMFQTLGETGTWEGEIWNRRKNGEIYPEWLTISTMYDSYGNIEGYVSLFSDITKRKQDEEHIVHQANYDSLTGLANRNLFSDRFSRALARADRTRDRVALLFIDLDRFKYVNDTLGHSVGDQLLKEVSKRLENHLRQTDTAARLGGDEFAAILPDIKDIHSLEDVVFKILNSLSEPYRLEDHDAFISASIGVTIFPDDGEDIDILLRNADSAMYKAKAKGRDNFQFFTQELTDEAQARRELETALHHAVKNQEFSVSYQPVIQLESGEISSAEALVRWHHPEKGIVPPSDFIPLAEEIGLIAPLGEWVLREACRQAVHWATITKNPPKVAVNISSRQFQRQNIPELVKAVLAETGLEAHRLTLEITESLLVADSDTILLQLQEIRQMGIGLSIDDFGTGYSSLSYLKKFPITTLKIDRSFVMDLTTNLEDRALVKAILSMAQSLNLKVVAEGVETDEQAAFLEKKHCQFVQGYLYSKPLPTAEFITYLETIER